MSCGSSPFNPATALPGHSFDACSSLGCEENTPAQCNLTIGIPSRARQSGENLFCYYLRLFGHLFEGLGAVISVGTKADLTALNVSELTDRQFIYVSGYWGVADGGGGIFYYAANSVAPADGIVVLSPDAGGGRFFRAWDGYNALPEWAGARGDGSTNDVAAIQAVINLFSAGGGTIHFGAKTYCIGGSLSVNKPNMSLIGLGPNVSKIRETTGTTSALLVINALRPQIRGLTFDRSTTALGGAGIELSQTALAVVEDCVFTDYAVGMYLNRATNSKVSRVLANITAGTVTWRGFWVSSISGGSVSSTFVDCIAAVGGTYTGAPFGAVLDGISVRDLTLLNFDTAGVNYGIYVNGSGLGAGEVLTNIQIINPIVDQYGETGILLVGANGAEDSITISNGWLNAKPTGAVTHGIFAQNVNGLSVVGTQFTADLNFAFNRAIGLSGCRNVTVSAALFKANNYGVMTSGSCQGVNVQGCSFFNPSGKPATTHVSLDATVRGSIVGNSLAGHATTGIAISASCDRLSVVANVVNPTNIPNPLVNLGTNGSAANNIVT